MGRILVSIRRKPFIGIANHYICKATATIYIYILIDLFLLKSQHSSESLHFMVLIYTLPLSNIQGVYVRI